MIMNKLMRIVAPLLRTVTRRPSCQDVNDFLADYLDGELDEATARRYEKHLGHCDTCETYFEQYRQTIDLARGCRDDALPEDLVEHTLVFLREQRAG